MKLDLLEKIEGKSQDQCEREFVKISPQEVSFKEKQRPLTEEFTQITFVASNKLKAKLDSLKNLIAHKNSNPIMAELIEISVDMALEKLDPIKDRVTTEEEINFSGSAADLAAMPLRKDPHSTGDLVKNSRYIPASIRKYIWKRDQGRCQYVDQETNKKCESRFAIQIDHIHPFSLGGGNSEENLRLLCRAHNQWRTQDL